MKETSEERGVFEVYLVMVYFRVKCLFSRIPRLVWRFCAGA